jgi:hypothetical protein
MEAVSERMRTKVTIAIILVAGAFLTAYLLTGTKTLSLAELENIRTACQECHGLVPEYDLALQVHDKHAAFECNSCHRDVGGLKTADDFHTVFKWLGIGMVSLALSGIITTLLASNRKDRVS